MNIKITLAYVIESPLYEIATEDGPGSTFNLQVVAQDKNGAEYTHLKTFERNEQAKADDFARKVNERGEINEAFWTRGTSWDFYATPQTYEEEKAEAYFNHGARA